MHSRSRTVQTRTLLVQTWIILSLEGHSSRLTVRQLCQRAGVSRGTFYLHFETLEDLRVQEESRMTEELFAYASELRRRSLTGRDPVSVLTAVFSPLLEALARQRDEVVVFLFHSDGRFGDKLSTYMRENLRATLGSIRNGQPLGDLHLEYLVAANFGVLTQWLKNGAAVPPGRVAALLAESHTKGVLNFPGQRLEK